MTTQSSSSSAPTHAVPDVDHPMITKVVPCADPVDPAVLLTAILGTIHRHVIIDPMQAVAVTLWIAMTWFMPCISIAPLLIITAPERACGKSQLLSIALRLVFRGLSAANTSAPFLFRAIESWQPTILIDEADTFIRENADIKGMLNAGHTRESAYVGRAVGKDGDFTPKLFCVWAAKVLAGIALEKHLPDSTMSRSMIVAMRRKLPGETIVRLRHADKEYFGVLASQLARFALDYSEQIRHARPHIPDELSDRAQDNWEPLFAIAECAGKAWSAKALAAARELSKVSEESVSHGNELLADIQDIFDACSDSKISSAKLIKALAADPENQWATYNRGRPVTPRQLSKMLGDYDIKSKTVRIGPYDTPKGYDRDQFSDAFSRYLTQQRNDPPESMQDKAPGVAPSVAPSVAPGVADEPEEFHNFSALMSPHKPMPDKANAPSNELKAAPAKHQSHSSSTAKLWQKISDAEKPRMPFDQRPDSDF